MTERTTAQLAELLGISKPAALALMEDSRDLGLVELSEDGRWRLTETAEREFGQALRAMDNTIQDSSEYAVDRRHEAA